MEDGQPLDAHPSSFDELSVYATWPIVALILECLLLSSYCLYQTARIRFCLSVHCIDVVLPALLGLIRYLEFIYIF
jgi:hypothetical protein